MTSQLNDAPISVVRAIFNRKYLISVPEIFCTGVNVIRETGVLTSGDRRVDAALEGAPRRRYCTIAGMIAFFEEGAPVSLLHPEKSVEIYALIIQHIRNWRWIVETFVDCDPPPAEDFILMDEFAKALHPLALAYGGDRTNDSAFHKRMRTIRGRFGAFIDKRKPVGNGKVRYLPAHSSDDVNAIVRRLWRDNEIEVYNEYPAE